MVQTIIILIRIIHAGILTMVRHNFTDDNSKSNNRNKNDDYNNNINGIDISNIINDYDVNNDDNSNNYFETNDNNLN